MTTNLCSFTKFINCSEDEDEMLTLEALSETVRMQEVDINNFDDEPEIREITSEFS